MDKTRIASLIAAMSPASVIYKGHKKDGLGSETAFEIRHGWDINLASQCDSEWSSKNIEILTFLQNNVSEDALEQEVAKLYMEDAHWRWLGKALNYCTDEYNWFFWTCKDIVHGACLIYHPKESVIDGQGIFYIEYVAVAPWNRPNPLAPIMFKGIGTELIRVAHKYATETLKLRPGFSLHSLPKAAAYYQKIGMKCFPEHKKDSLDYFEMPREAAESFGGIANA
ncbi:hypothetical protein ABL980_29965 [Pseudomonas aeruginosa]|uniref:hypothetical protein n=1 Tax=Pseudomonas aeruginosa TaxID=287 RepID=UPI00259D46FF|nr:hypothetical protein [Pseudomonas aeruginosa]